MADSWTLYYITDRSQFPGDDSARLRALLDEIAEAARAGVDYIQLREKDLTARDLEDLARQAVALIHRGQSPAEHSSRTTRVLINSRTDIAMAADADGVHLRAQDISPSDVQQIWRSCGAGAFTRRAPVITCSCHTTEDVRRAQSGGAGFAIFAPVFEKPGSSPAGLAALREACRENIPVLALGGVTLENAAACRQAGAAGVAGIRLFQENKIEDVVRALRML